MNFISWLLLVWVLILVPSLICSWCSIVCPWLLEPKSPMWVFYSKELKSTLYFYRRVDKNIEEEWNFSDLEAWWMSYELLLKFPYNDPRQILMKEGCRSCLRLIWCLGMYISDDQLRMEVGVCLDELQEFYFSNYEVLCESIFLMSCHEVGCLEYDCGVSKMRNVFKVSYEKGYHLFESCIRLSSPGMSRSSMIKLFEEWTLVHELLIKCCDELSMELAMVKLSYWKLLKWKFWYNWEYFKGGTRKK